MGKILTDIVKTAVLTVAVPIVGLLAEELPDISKYFRGENKKETIQKGPIEKRHTNNPFTALDWVIPDTNYFGLNRGIYTLKEVKENTGNSLLMRILEQPTLGFGATPTPKSLKEKVSFMLNDICPECDGLLIGNEINFHFFSDEAENKNWGTLFDYLEDVGVVDRKEGIFSIQNNYISHLFFTLNYKNFIKSVDLMSELSHKLKEKEKEAILYSYTISKKILDYRLKLVEGISSIRNTEKLNNISKGSVDPVFEYWVNSEGFMDLDNICNHLKIKNKFLTRRLTLKRMTETLGEKDTNAVKNSLSKLEATHAIAFAEWFARSRIQKYGQTDMVRSQGDIREKLARGKNVNYVFGDCKDFAAITAYTLKEIIQPINRNLDGWHFGVRDESNHRYMVAVKMYEKNNDTKFSVLFFDPTRLSNQRFSELNYDKIIKITDATEDSQHYVEIPRYFADMIRHKINPDAAFKDEMLLPDRKLELKLK